MVWPPFSTIIDPDSRALPGPDPPHPPLQVLWFAVVGTLWNSIGIGMSLFAICQIEAFGVQDINLQENLLFATIISAVDPVAVLSVFEDVSVNEQLYIVVFGECLFNDAVTVVRGAGRVSSGPGLQRAGSKGRGLWLYVGLVSVEVRMKEVRGPGGSTHRCLLNVATGQHCTVNWKSRFIFIS